MALQQIDSKIISFVRFPMIVGIVMIHSGLIPESELVNFPAYDYIVGRGIIDGLTRLCVPLFFMISGYLFFAQSTFNRLVYFKKLKKHLWDARLKPLER